MDNNMSNQTNIERHSYTNFTGKPYIHHHGIPTKKSTGYNPNTVPPVNHKRTIIRTITPDCHIYCDIPSNGMNDFNFRKF